MPSTIWERLLILKGDRSLKEFAALLDIPPSTLYYYLNGREPSLSSLRRVCEKLNVSEEWLLTGNGPLLKNKEDKLPEVIELIVKFLKENWQKWSIKKRHWFEVQFKNLFPEFNEWLKKQIL